MIRQATHADIPRLVELGAMMHAESPAYSRLAFSPEKLATTLGVTVDRGFAQVVETDWRVIGGMFGLVVPHWFSDDLQACDLALFIEPQFRGGMAAVRLLRAYGEWAKESGAKQILFGITTGIDVETTQMLCERLGWRRAGVVMEMT